MSDVLSIALSGLTAQKQRVAVAANNIANVSTAGRVPTDANPVSTVYRPLGVSLTALTSGGVQATVTEDKNGTSVSYDPSNYYANEEGFIAVPNVDLNREIVNVLESKVLFRANLSVLKTQEKMLGELLDTVG